MPQIRLTGGEPTLRKDLVPLVEALGGLRPLGLRDVAITSNGIVLGRSLPTLQRAGAQRARLCHLASNRLPLHCCCLRDAGCIPSRRAAMRCVRQPGRPRTAPARPPSLARPIFLHPAGLSAVNISLDTLRPERFETLARRPGHERVMESIRTAVRLGYDPVKVRQPYSGWAGAVTAPSLSVLEDCRCTTHVLMRARRASCPLYGGRAG